MAIIGGGRGEDQAPEKEGPKKVTERVLKGNWLKHYQDYTSESESPDSYHLWTGLSILASAVRRNVWLNQGTFLLYPNLYIVLVGPAGKVRKSTSIRLGRTLLKGVENIHFGPDSVTREELINALGKISTKAKQAALTIHSTELSSLIEPSGIKMIQFLTDIFDGDVKWQYSTKHQGKDVIHQPVLNILGATTPSWIADSMPASVTEHGFTARVVFVYESEKRFLNPFPKEPDGLLIKDLIWDLDHISRIEGPFTWGTGTKDLYAEIYKKLDATRPKDYRIEGFHYRKDILILKVAMLLTIAESDDLVIQPRDINVALQLLNEVETSMHKTFSAVGKYEHAADYERILAAIIDAGEEGLNSEQIHSQFYSVGDVQELAKILQMLCSTGTVDRIQAGKGQPSIYRARALGV